ncbi:hypothetical protein FHR81_004598 [Actinoalloteichus hoggarensis]|uniref:Uncharacterized protein n=1 Tax=Actinoalloteichus hoggarensis TaxID=1470176 RepID=A0A221W4H3_9PSEU|nr:hypothetical protein AHOG_14225 [Actinoalloteichus hoggarensis]MBB5923527.1 hypothetical protein [Actinoalloteichus hoggarensis]
MVASMCLPGRRVDDAVPPVSLGAQCGRRLRPTNGVDVESTRRLTAYRPPQARDTVPGPRGRRQGQRVSPARRSW